MVRLSQRLESLCGSLYRRRIKNRFCRGGNRKFSPGIFPPVGSSPSFWRRGPGHLRARILGPRNRTLFTEVPAALFHRANLLLNMRSVKCEAPELQCFPYRLPSSAKQRGRPVSLRFDVLPDFPSPSPRMLPSPDGESDEALKEPPRHLLSAETASFLSRTANGGKKFLLPKQHDR